MSIYRQHAENSSVPDITAFLRGHQQAINTRLVSNGVNPGIAAAVVGNRFYLEYAGIFAHSRNLFPGEELRDDVLRHDAATNLALANPSFRSKILAAVRSGYPYYPAPFVFRTQDHYKATIDLFSQLQANLLKQRLSGKKLEDMAMRYIRPYDWLLTQNMPKGIVTKFISITRDGEPCMSVSLSYEGDKIHISDLIPLWRQLAAWGIPENDVEQLTRELDTGKQPNVIISPKLSDVPFLETPLLGVDLSQASSVQIYELASGGPNCPVSCRYYHGSVPELKREELIAPVDGKVFGAEIYFAYQQWKTNPQKTNEKFTILIPAQADETSFTKIVGYLNSRGVTSDEIKTNFAFELADICVTPLLRVYASLKEKDMLGNANVSVKSAFEWKGSFDIIMGDYFLDLFSRNNNQGNLSQERLLSVFINNLANNGRIILTVRGGTNESPLSKEIVKARFFEKVDQHMIQLLDALTKRQNADDRGYIGGTHNPRRDALLLNALFDYRELREVYPISTEDELQELLAKVHQITDIPFSSQTAILDKGKVKLVITRTS